MTKIRLPLLIVVLLTLATVEVYAVSFPDYFPITPSDYGVRTFTQTFGGSDEYVSQIVGSMEVPYLSGARSGVVMSPYSSEVDPLIVSNDGNEVRFLGGNGVYLSTDESLTAHPDSWTFGELSDGQIIDQRGSYRVATDGSFSLIEEDQLILIDIQSVSALYGTYTDAVIMWYLDDKYDNPWISGGGELFGISLPTAGDTQGYSVTGFEIFAPGVGAIAEGDVAAESGLLNTVFQLKEITPVPEPSSMLLLGIGLAGLAGLRRKQFMK